MYAIQVFVKMLNILIFSCLQYYHLCKFGCNDPVKTSTAFYVYIELCEGIVYSFDNTERESIYN